MVNIGEVIEPTNAVGLRRTWRKSGAPTDGASGTLVGVADPGDMLIDYTNKKIYQNTNTKASPTWVEITTHFSQILYVDVNEASSGETGTPNEPFKTQQAAVDAIAALGDNSDIKGYVIMVAPGIYTETLTLEDDALYNLAFIAMGGPNSVILDPASGDALESEIDNTNLHYLYFNGFRFKGNIDFNGELNDTKFLYNDCVFEDCTFDEDNDTITIDVQNANRFYWKNGRIHVMSNLVFYNVASCGIRGEGYSEIFPVTGAPGTLLLNANSTNSLVPYMMADAHGGGDQASFKIDGAHVQRRLPTLTNTGTGKQFLTVRHGYLGMGVQTLTIPSGSSLYLYGAVLNHTVVCSSGSTLWCYNSVVITSLTQSGTSHVYASET